MQESHFHRVCRAGKGADTCRYIVGTPTGIRCGKLMPDLRAIIDSREMVAKGDNCDGLDSEIDLADPSVVASPRQIVVVNKGSHLDN